MKIVKGFSLRNIAGSHIVVPIGSANISFKGMITLNGSGAFIWKQLEEDRTELDLLLALQKEYEIDETAARSDISEFIGILQQAALLE